MAAAHANTLVEATQLRCVTTVHVALLRPAVLAVQVKYARTGPTTFAKTYDYPSRPGAPWSYPQTGEGSPKSASLRRKLLQRHTGRNIKQAASKHTL